MKSKSLAPVNKERDDLRKSNGELLDELKSVQEKLKELQRYENLVKQAFALYPSENDMRHSFFQINDSLSKENDRLKKELAELKPDHDQFIPQP